MTPDQRRRVILAISETNEAYAKRFTQKTFDAQQEAEKQKDLAFYSSHLLKLQSMLSA